MSLPDIDDLPSYGNAVSNSGPSSTAPIHFRVQTEVHSQLSSLGEQISRAQGRRLQDVYDQDQQVLDLLIPLINSFLEDYSKSGLPHAKLVIVPASRVSQGATPADNDLLSEDEFFRLERSPGNPETRTFWDDADVAQRVATYLQPATGRNPYISQGATRAEDIQWQAPRNETKRPFWKRAGSGARSHASATPMLLDHPDEKHSGDPLVTMDVKAEEVAFRTQTPFGLYGTESGWGIVVRIVVHVK